MPQLMGRKPIHDGFHALGNDLLVSRTRSIQDQVPQGSLAKDRARVRRRGFGYHAIQDTAVLLSHATCLDPNSNKELTDVFV